MGVLTSIAPAWMLKRMAIAKRERTHSSIDTLTKCCPRFAENWDTQQHSGLDEETWFRWIAALANAGFQKDALTFSKGSRKHNEQSERRIEELTSGNHGPTRCKSMGCGDDQMRQCFGNELSKNEAGELTHSPAAFLQRKLTKRKPEQEPLFNDLPEGYAIENGLLCEMVYYKENVKAVPISNFLAVPTKTIVKDNGQEKQRFYQIEGIIPRTGKRLPAILVPDSQFAAMQWPSGWGLEPNLFPGPTVKDKARYVFQHLGQHAVEESVFTHIGWKEINGSSCYLHANGCIGATNVKVELEDRLSKYKLPTSPGDRVKASQASLALLELAPLRITLPLFAFMYLAPLRKWLEEASLPPALLLWVYGRTGARKSSISALYLCHYGTFTAKNLPASFKDTANSIEKLASDCRDCVLLVDDYHPNNNPVDAKKMEQIAQQLVRGYGDLQGRNRMNADGSLRITNVPRGLCLITAEDMISGSSSNSRLFPVEVLPGDVDLDKLTQAQKDSKLLSQAMVGYLEWLGQEMQEQDIESLTEFLHEKRNEASRLDVHGRLVEAATMLYTGLHYALKYALSIGAITHERHDQILTEGWELFLDIANEQGEQVVEVKPTTRFLSIVSQLLANKSIHTVNVKQQEPDGVSLSGAHVGWHDKEFYYFLPDPLYNVVSQFLSRQEERFPITKQMLWRQLADEGFTQIEIEGKQKRYTKKKSIGRFRDRTLWVKVSALRGAEERLTARARREQATSPEMEALFAPEDGEQAPET
ncbi:DUF927 domain-containing protein [Paenibacillus oryzisoli]|uniref:DUF927 domain-containing protein n=1 Tax=Paenibacillus oryzisoli TaxID=1850517 RepID=UPI003D2E61C1